MFAAIVNMRTTMVCARFAMTAGGVFPLNASAGQSLGAPRMQPRASAWFCVVLLNGIRLERFTTQFASGKRPSALDKVVHDNECALSKCTSWRSSEGVEPGTNSGPAGSDGSGAFGQGHHSFVMKRHSCGGGLSTVAAAMRAGSLGSKHSRSTPIVQYEVTW